MKAVILQSNYIPWKGYFDLINDADIFVFYDCVKYTKNDWRNRNKIATTNGVQWLTIPISSKATNLMIDEVTIEDKYWQEKHFKTLYYAYKKAPYFHQLEELINDYLLEKKWEYLSDLNQYLIKKISQKLSINTEFRNAREFKLEGDRVNKLINILKELNISTYISGPSAKEYLCGHENLFDENNIKLIYKSYPAYPAYKQFSPNFENYVSIVDMIAHLPWDNIANYIWNYEKK